MSQAAMDTPPTPMLGAEGLVTALLYSVSHDLRSPLLTLSLSAELIDESVGEVLRTDGSGRGTIALDALRHGARDLERMVQALASLSRAYRRELGVGRAALRLLLGGHLVISDEDELDTRLVLVDPISVREVIDACCGDDPAEIHVSLTPRHAILLLPSPPALGDLRGAPLLRLVEGLQRHAGGVLEALAAGQVMLERQGSALDLQEAGVRLWLPRAGAAAE